MWWRYVVKQTIIGLTLTGVFFPILWWALSIQAPGISSSNSLNNSVQCIYQTHHLRFLQNHLHHRHLKVLRQSLLAFHTVLNWHTFWLDEKTLFWRLPKWVFTFSHSVRDSSSLSILIYLSESWLSTVSFIRIKFDCSCEPVPFMSDMILTWS